MQIHFMLCKIYCKLYSNGFFYFQSLYSMKLNIHNVNCNIKLHYFCLHCFLIKPIKSKVKHKCRICLYIIEFYFIIWMHACERRDVIAPRDHISKGEGEAAAALWTTIPIIPSARQQQQLGCCDNGGSQRLLWLQRLYRWAETSVYCFGRCQSLWLHIRSYNCDRRRLQSTVDSTLVCVDERLHRANALAN